MTTVSGTMKYRRLNPGTKSEGDFAILECPDGKEYMLYRSGHLPTDDDYFTEYDGKEITVDGSMEETTGYLMVTSITPVDGTPVNGE